MADYTTDEINSAVEEDGDGWGDLSHSRDGHKVTVSIHDEPVEIEKVGGKAPAEGGGEDVFVVVKIDGRYFRKSGYYASHYGCDWDGDVTEVRPAQKTITVYEAV